MAAESIISQDLSLAEVFQSFYRVPSYQREYVWGEADDGKGKSGDEVEKFLEDINNEFSQAASPDAPEYFIGTVVVCAGEDRVFELIDGQQRTTTSFLVLCAIRDALIELDKEPPSTLKGQIADGSMDWQGKTVHRMRLELQYEDASGVLAAYGTGVDPSPNKKNTRSTKNLANAYQTIREFLRTNFTGEEDILRFCGFFTNKVKLIRIQTPSVGRALKIFETINDRGIGLDAMDLLKNLLFMNSKPHEFDKLRDIWKDITQNIYDAHEKPLRFLRYYLLANYDIEMYLREEEIYKWLGDNKGKTNHEKEPLAFAQQLRDGAVAYWQFNRGYNLAGEVEHGIVNTRHLGGSAVKQHYILLLAGRHLDASIFESLCVSVEQLMFTWLIAGVPTKEYERLIIQAARRLRSITTRKDYEKFQDDFVIVEKKKRLKEFHENIQEMCSWQLRKFRLKYLLAKITQFVEIAAYGEQGRKPLAHYLDTQNDIEHILAANADVSAKTEFGEGADDPEWVEGLGNLMWLERSINRSIQNVSYSKKLAAYSTSHFLLARCQSEKLRVGVNDQITRAIKRLDIAPTWNKEAITKRQNWMADISLDVWSLRQ